MTLYNGGYACHPPPPSNPTSETRSGKWLFWIFVSLRFPVMINGKYCCPKIYFNHRCFSGPYLNKGRIAELPQCVGPGNCVLVLREVRFLPRAKELGNFTAVSWTHPYKDLHAIHVTMLGLIRNDSFFSCIVQWTRHIITFAPSGTFT